MRLKLHVIIAVIGVSFVLESCASHLTKQDMARDIRYGKISAKKVFTDEERRGSVSIFSKFFRTGGGFTSSMAGALGAVGGAIGSVLDTQTGSRDKNPSRAPVEPAIEWGAKEYSVIFISSPDKELTLLDYGNYEVGECVAVFPDYAVDGDGRLDKTSANNCNNQKPIEPAASK